MTVNATDASEQAEQAQAQQQQLAEQNALNALQANIEEKRERSYYYAHRPRETSEERAPMPVHVVLERSVTEPAPTVVTIFNYAWADEGDVVKVYIPLEGVGRQCGEDDVKTTVQDTMLQVDVSGYKPGQVQRLLVAKLYGNVVPEQCRTRKLANKVVVTLKKAVSSKWSNLKAA